MISLDELLAAAGIGRDDPNGYMPPDLDPMAYMPRPMMPTPQPVEAPPMQLPGAGGGGFAENFGLALAQSPLAYRSRGRGGAEDFIGNLLASAGNTYAGATARGVQQREGFNERQRIAMADRNRSNIAASRLAEREKIERLQKVSDSARTLRERREEKREENAESDRRAYRDAALRRAGESGGDDAAIAISGPALDMAARRYLIDGTLPAMGMGKKSAAVRVRIIERAAEIDPNANIAGNAADFASNKASLATMQKMSDNALAFANTAHKNSKVMLDAMAKISDTGSAVLNRPLRDIDRKLLGSEETAAYETALRTVIPEFARLLNNPNMTGVLSDAARKEIEDMANGGYSLKQMAAVIRTLETDADNRTQSYKAQLDEIRGRINPSRRTAADPLGLRGGTHPDSARSRDPLGVR